jgi:uracil-DNA glycosylase family 4
VDPGAKLRLLQERIITCRRCPRLVRYRERVAREKRRAYRDWDYWGRPVPGFGDPKAELLVLGLAPAAHGGNRTGRVFTGDRSGDFLYRELFQAGFSNQPTSISLDDGLNLKNCYITASVRCCPPQNKPTPGEQGNCRPFLEKELQLLTNVRAVLALGRLAHHTYVRLSQEGGGVRHLADVPFAHGAWHDLPVPYPPMRRVRLFDSFHPSQQNTQTGRLTPAMFRRVLQQVGRFLSEGSQPG